MDDEERKGLKSAAEAAADGGITALAAATGAALLGPMGAVAFPVAYAVFKPLVNGHMSQRAAARARDFEESTLRALMKSGLTFEEFRALSDEKKETVFQAYRRALDAHEPAVVPALGRLTAMALPEGKDRFFIGAGRMLEQMTGAEFAKLVEVVQGAGAIPNDEGRRVEFVRLHRDKTVVGALLEGRAITSDAKDGPEWVLDEDLAAALSAASRFGLGRVASEDPRAGTFGAPQYLLSMDWTTLTRLAALFD